MTQSISSVVKESVCNFSNVELGVPWSAIIARFFPSTLMILISPDFSLSLTTSPITVSPAWTRNILLYVDANHAINFADNTCQ